MISSLKTQSRLIGRCPRIEVTLRQGGDVADSGRIRAGHPAEEADDVVCDIGYWKRVLGTGQPSRAFGNLAFKRDPELVDR